VKAERNTKRIFFFIAEAHPNFINLIKLVQKVD